MQYNALFIDNKVDDNNKVIYLTFDAGYENGNVEKILDTLKKENVPAAFFLLDNIILKNTDLVIRMAEEGHLVCNHTKNHKNLSRSEESEIIENLKALEDIYRECTGRELDKYFRFPEGKYSIDALRHVNNLGYTTVFWSFAYEDWDNNKQPNTDKAIKKILDNTHNGAVMLFHPTSDTNAKILPTLIKEWKRMGYSFGTLNQLKEKNYNK
jgi:peptidoglycan-N-acetylmuramic acid deacetylase